MVVKKRSFYAGVMTGQTEFKAEIWGLECIVKMQSLERGMLSFWPLWEKSNNLSYTSKYCNSGKIKMYSAKVRKCFNKLFLKLYYFGHHEILLKMHSSRRWIPKFWLSSKLFYDILSDYDFKNFSELYAVIFTF